MTGRAFGIHLIKVLWRACVHLDYLNMNHLDHREANAYEYQQPKINMLRIHTNCSLDFHLVLKWIYNDSKRKKTLLPFKSLAPMYTHLRDLMDSALNQLKFYLNHQRNGFDNLEHLIYRNRTLYHCMQPL